MPTYEPGLGCPHCSDAFYTPGERAQHIRAEHPGEYAGPTADMVAVAQRANVTLGDIFSDRRIKRTNPDHPAIPQEGKGKILQMPKSGSRKKK